MIWTRFGHDLGTIICIIPNNNKLLGEGDKGTTIILKYKFNKYNIMNYEYMSE